MDWITLKTEFAVGGVSRVREIWQEPPPWVAWPWKAMVCGLLMGMLFHCVMA